MRKDEGSADRRPQRPAARTREGDSTGAAACAVGDHRCCRERHHDRADPGAPPRWADPGRRLHHLPLRAEHRRWARLDLQPRHGHDERCDVVPMDRSPRRRRVAHRVDRRHREGVLRAVPRRHRRSHVRNAAALRGGDRRCRGRGAARERAVAVVRDRHGVRPPLAAGRRCHRGHRTARALGGARRARLLRARRGRAVCGRARDHAVGVASRSPGRVRARSGSGGGADAARRGGDDRQRDPWHVCREARSGTLGVLG